MKTRFELSHIIDEAVPDEQTIEEALNKLDVDPDEFTEYVIAILKVRRAEGDSTIAACLHTAAICLILGSNIVVRGSTAGES